MSRARNGALAAAVLAAAATATPVIVKWEGWERAAYPDVANVWTICAGDTKGVRPGQVASDGECESRLGQRAVEIGFQIAPCLPDELPVQTRAAFISTAYNIGPTAFCGSSMSRLARAGDLPGACNALSRWNKARVGGVLTALRGLMARRTDERALCLSGLA